MAFMESTANTSFSRKRNCSWWYWRASTLHSFSCKLHLNSVFVNSAARRQLTSIQRINETINSFDLVSVLRLYCSVLIQIDYNHSILSGLTGLCIIPSTKAVYCSGSTELCECLILWWLKPKMQKQFAVKKKSFLIYLFIFIFWVKGSLPGSL